MPEIQVRRLHPDARLPHYAHEGPLGDLAADLHSIDALTIAAGQTVAVPTGIALGFPAGFGGLIHDRSSLALRGLHTLAGVIDPGYRGEIKIVMTNLSPDTVTLDAGTRIAQMRIVPLLQAMFTACDELDATVRSQGSFGSTGA